MEEKHLRNLTTDRLYRYHSMVFPVKNKYEYSKFKIVHMETHTEFNFESKNKLVVQNIKIQMFKWNWAVSFLFLTLEKTFLHYITNILCWLYWKLIGVLEMQAEWFIWLLQNLTEAIGLYIFCYVVSGHFQISSHALLNVQEEE